jgi:hypothetical protein
MTLHFSHIGFTDDLTFIIFPPFRKVRFKVYYTGFLIARIFLLISPDDPALRKIIR